MPGKKSAIYGAVYDPRGGSAKQVTVELSSPSVLGLRDKSGYAPEQLDPTIQVLIDNARRGSELLQQYTPMLGALMTRLQDEVAVMLEGAKHEGEVAAGPSRLDVAVDLSGKVSVILERLSKMTMNAV